MLVLYTRQRCLTRLNKNVRRNESSFGSGRFTTSDVKQVCRVDTISRSINQRPVHDKNRVQSTRQRRYWSKCFCALEQRCVTYEVLALIKFSTSPSQEQTSNSLVCFSNKLLHSSYNEWSILKQKSAWWCERPHPKNWNLPNMSNCFCGHVGLQRLIVMLSRSFTVCLLDPAISQLCESWHDGCRWRPPPLAKT